MSIPVIAIFDIGKTNKKLFLFDELYNIVYEKSIQFAEIVDEDGEACEDLQVLTTWILDTFNEVALLKNFAIKALNFSTYGASFVHLDLAGKPVAPLYNYLKAFPNSLHQQFYENYGTETSFSLETASPVLGNLNSGLQLYFIKYAKPALFKKIHSSLHLPQFISYLFTAKTYSELTSIGCHTALWNFTTHAYHGWVLKEEMNKQLPQIIDSDSTLLVANEHLSYYCGVGLHDSSAALIPYLATFSEPFILISTGTWCITLNPFNDSPLTATELAQDCLCYFSYKGKSVKASRLFAGYEHEEQTKRLAAHFNVAEDYFKTVNYDNDLYQLILSNKKTTLEASDHLLMSKSVFGKRALDLFTTYEEAYHQLIYDLVVQQIASTRLVFNQDKVNNIYVDGGFSNNVVYMKMLALAFPTVKVYAATIAQASSIGAALAIHNSWNHTSLNQRMVELKLFL